MRKIPVSTILFAICFAYGVNAVAQTTPRNERKAAKSSCTGKGIELQVLGSGGPELQTGRASSSYLVWQDGTARVLIDSGGGSALRFGEAGANMADLELVLFTHLHADHSADFPALVKSSNFEERKRPLPVYGPAGNKLFPSTTEFVASLFNAKRGSFRYLSEFITPGAGSYVLQSHAIAPGPHEVRRVFSGGGISADATTVIHGPVPALAWRVQIGDTRLVFSGDTNGDNGNLQTLAAQADIFVAHNAVPEGVSGGARKLHMPPSVIGQIAGAAKVKHLVISHRMLRTLGKEQETRTAIEQHYKGPTKFADDLDCFAVH